MQSTYNSNWDKVSGLWVIFYLSNSTQIKCYETILVSPPSLFNIFTNNLNFTVYCLFKNHFYCGIVVDSFLPIPSTLNLFATLFSVSTIFLKRKVTRQSICHTWMSQKFIYPEFANNHFYSSNSHLDGGK